MTIQINSFEELVGFIQGNDLDSEQLNILLIHSMGVFCDDEQLDLPKAVLIQILKRYWSEYGKNVERPIFLPV